MKYNILILTLFLSSFADAQPNREKLALMDEEAFNMSFNFQLQGSPNFTVTFIRKDKIDYIQITDINDCHANNLNRDTPISDLYIYEQFLNYLQDLNITTYQPSSGNANNEATLNVQASLSISRTWTINAFMFQHHPDNTGEEAQILTFVSDILTDNAVDDCSRDLAKKLAIHVKGE